MRKKMVIFGYRNPHRYQFMTVSSKAITFYRTLFAGLVVSLNASLYPLHAQEAQTLPRIEMTDLTYAGAFRLPADTYGASSMNYAEGPIAYNPGRHTLFVVGHSHQQALAEFAIPPLVTSQALTDLLIADPPRQAFATVLDKVNGGNPQALDRIGGLVCLETQAGRELMVNSYEYYDAPADNSLSTFIVRDADNLAASSIDGFISLNPEAAHVSGWLSPIPAIWQPLLGGTYLTGHASGIPIIGRTSVGPSAFAFDPFQVAGTSNVPSSLPTTRLMDFSLAHPLHPDLDNNTRANDIWTHLSRAVYGFIVPGTRTYMTLGYSGGHQSGVCYKCTQTDGTLCDGYCAPDANDYDQFYWLWDVNDMVEVREGRLDAHAVRPYAYGPLPTPLQGATPAINGATVDFNDGILYLALREADTAQGEFNNPPVILAYALPDISKSVALEADELPTGIKLSPVYPNPVQNQASFDVVLPQSSQVAIQVYDSLGREIQELFNGLFAGNQSQTIVFTSSHWPAGHYFIRIQTEEASRLLSFIHQP